MEGRGEKKERVNGRMGEWERGRKGDIGTKGTRA
jgi:hypothetical protein